MTILGIDLGTTNSLCSAFIDGKAVLIPNIHAEYMTPSVIALNDQNEIVIGKAALEYAAINKFNAVKSFKRFMGSNKVFKLGSQEFRAEELSALILKNLKQDAELFLGKSIDTAIISVPAYFNNKQRNATKLAAEMAGLKVSRLINEPTAAALCYGIANKDQNTKYLVFDLGGGTFDITIMELFEGILEVRASAGDNLLGGDDFNDAIVHDFCKHNNWMLADLDPKLQNQLWVQAEKCKIYLNDSKNTDFEINCESEGASYSKVYTAKDLETIFSPLIDRLLKPIKRALNDSSLVAEELDAVIFVGGATKLANLSKICARLFKKLPFVFHDPQHVVALGAATLAGMQENNTELSEFVLTDVSPYTLGTSCIVGDEQHGYQLEFSPIIDRNSTLPTSKSRTYYIEPQQKHILIDVYQGESRKLENNIKIAEFNLDVPKVTDDRQFLEIRFTYDNNGILEVEIHFKNSNSKKFVVKESCGSLSDAEIEAALSKLSALKIHPREKDINTTILARAERLYEENIGEIREELSFQIRKFQAALETQEESTIELARFEFATFLDEFEFAYE